MANEHTPTNPLARLTLREQQVLQLRREMMHPGGVRIQLRRKDCIGSIAFVDAFGGVWISGWKQKDHPMLYNALHIGDQVISIGGITVANANDANKIIRNSQNLFVSTSFCRNNYKFEYSRYCMIFRLKYSYGAFRLAAFMRFDEILKGNVWA